MGNATDTNDPTGTPGAPPFDPDPDLITFLERGKEPTEAEVREMAERVRARSARGRED